MLVRSLLLLSLFISPSLFAQVTINDQDMPAVDDTIRYSITNDQWSLTTGGTGTAQIWDYSMLLPQTQRLDTFFAQNASVIPIGYQFFFNNQILYPAHKANYATRGQDIGFQTFFTLTNVFNFFKNDAQGYKNVGIGANLNGVPLSIRNIPIDTIYRFDMVYGSTYDSYSEFELNIPNTGYYQQKKNVQAEVDGEGTLTTPFGTFQALRVKLTIDIHDSIYIAAATFGFGFDRPTEIQYHWLADGQKVPLLNISEINGNITTITYRDHFVTNVGISENEKTPELSAFPVPASDVVFLKGEFVKELDRLEILSLNGQLIKTVNVYPGNLVPFVQVDDLPNGNYLIRATSANHQQAIVRFAVAR